jgi:hypothetical protein
LEQAVERFGEDRTVERLRKSPGLDRIDLERARLFLDRRLLDEE